MGIVLLSIVIIGIIGISYYTKQLGEIEATSKALLIEEVETNISKLGEKNISRIEIKDENVLSLEKRDHEWINGEEPELKYDSELINSLVKYIKTWKSISVLRHVEDYSAYGITEASRMITLYDEENNSETFRIGTTNGDQTQFYVSSDEEEVLYSVDAEMSKIVLIEPEALVDITLELPKKEAITSIEITMKEDRPIRLIKDKVWSLMDYYNAPHEVLPEAIEEILGQTQLLAKDGFVGQMTDTTTYGLDKPSLIIKLNEAHRLSFGNKENGFVYFRYNDEKYIYKMDEQRIKGLENIKPIDIICKEVYKADLEQIEKIEMTNPQASFTLTMDQKETGVAITSHLENVALDEGKTQEVIKLIEDSVSIAALLQNPQIEQKEERKAEITIVYTMKDNSTKNIELIPYDIEFYVLRFNGEVEFAVSKEKVIELFSSLDQILKANMS